MCSTLDGPVVDTLLPVLGTPSRWDSRTSSSSWFSGFGRVEIERLYYVKQKAHHA